jgi:hypothetical protein
MTARLGATVANPVGAGSDVSSGTYRSCRLDEAPAPVPLVRDGKYGTVSGGGSVQDPYPDQYPGRRSPESESCLSRLN